MSNLVPGLVALWIISAWHMDLVHITKNELKEVNSINKDVNISTANEVMK